jgi:F-type H+-transporting ATPase subunit gamma
MAFAARRSPQLGAAAASAHGARRAAVAAPVAANLQVRHGANLKEIRMRIASVTNMVKITGTMKMIASARLAPQQRRLAAVRPFVQGNERALGPPEDLDAGKKTAVVAITTDRGLCGGVNTFATRKAKKVLQEAKKDGGEAFLCLLGEKGAGTLGRDDEVINDIVFSTEELAKVPPTFTGVSLLADMVLAQEPDNVQVVYNYFTNAAAYETVADEQGNFQLLLPKEVFDEYEWEEDEKATHMQDLCEYLVAIKMWGGLTESATTELAQRMSAMDNANRNAGEMLGSLNVTYNRQRQAAITTELTEIISGAAAISE